MLELLQEKAFEIALTVVFISAVGYVVRRLGIPELRRGIDGLNERMDYHNKLTESFVQQEAEQHKEYMQATNQRILQGSQEHLLVMGGQEAIGKGIERIETELRREGKH